VTQDIGTHTQRVVDVVIAIHIGQVRTLAALEAERRAAQAHVAVYAAGDARLRQIMVLLRR